MDKELLKYVLHKKGKSVEDLARHLGVTRQALSLKLNGKTNWTLQEVKSTASFMGLDDADIKAIFFNE